ncbi:MAG: FAD-dependent oxidoreductase [Pseudomonadota bacterium]
MSARTAILGAGLAGLTCARALAEAGREAVVYDKSRGLGGRLGQRRAEGPSGEALRFDHGAQYLTARTPEFRELLETLETAGAAARWSPEGFEPKDRWVGLPGMSGLARPLAEGLDIRPSKEAVAVELLSDGWHVGFADGDLDGPFEALAVAIPAPQAAKLLPAAAEALSAVDMEPCWTLMAVFEDRPAELPEAAAGDGPLAWIARNAAKPGRPDAEAWVVQASREWSREYLELDRQEACDALLRLLGETGAAPRIDWAAAHRWRYARAATPLGAPFAEIEGPGGEIAVIGGDWTLGTKAEHAFLSGRAMAERLLG